jgi:hypothetical protein
MDEIRITITLEHQEVEALVKMAKAEFRHPKDQLHFILRTELEHRGLLVDTQTDHQCEETKQGVLNG